MDSREEFIEIIKREWLLNVIDLENNMDLFPKLKDRILRVYPSKETIHGMFKLLSCDSCILIDGKLLQMVFLC